MDGRYGRPPGDVSYYPAPDRDARVHSEREDLAPSRHLWVGNVASSVTDPEMYEAFSKFGPLEELKVYADRNYAFVNYKQTKDAVAAKASLTGVVFRGSPIRIEYAKGAKPSRYLWVGGVGSSVSKEQLLGSFQKFGKVEEVRFLRERNCAFVNYTNQEDATNALEALNGSRLGNEELRVDYGKFPEKGRQFDSRQPAPRQEHPRQEDHRPKGTRGDWNPDELNEPSACLWVGYPPSLRVDERLLRELFSPYGKVEKVRTFPSRPYAFVQFADIDTAARAKEGFRTSGHPLSLDQRVSVRFSKNEVGDGRRQDLDSRGRPISPPRGARRPYDDAPADYRAPHFREQEASPPHNKRPRTEGYYAGPNAEPSREGYGPPNLRPGYPDFGPGKLAEVPGFNPLPEGPLARPPPLAPPLGLAPPPGPPLGPPAPGFGPPPTAPGPVRPPGGPRPPDQLEWFGTLAKSGTSVCRARAFNIGKIPDVPMPEVINCTARTDLDTLARHVYTTADYSVVCFEPASLVEEAPYVDFMKYLGEKRRAGVAKWGEGGTTLFLVPPSEFSVDVLKVPRNDCLLGVIMTVRATHMVMPGGGSVPPVAGPPGGQIPPQVPHGVPSQPPPQYAHDYRASNPVPPANLTPPPVPPPQAPPNGLASLTPDVLASLTALLPESQKSVFVQALAAAGVAPTPPNPNLAQPPGFPQGRPTTSHAQQPPGPPPSASPALPPGFGAPQGLTRPAESRWPPPQQYNGGGYDRTSTPQAQQPSSAPPYDRQYADRQVSPLRNGPGSYNHASAAQGETMSPQRAMRGFPNPPSSALPAQQGYDMQRSPPRAPPSELPSAQLAQLTALLAQQPSSQAQYSSSQVAGSFSQPYAAQQGSGPQQQSWQGQGAQPQAAGSEREPGDGQDRIQATFQLAAMLLQQMQQQQGQGGQPPGQGPAE